MTPIRIRIVRNSRRRELPEVRTVCAECQSNIEPDAKFCGHCHAPIVRRYCPGCSRLVPENTETCPFCGSSAKARARQSGSLLTIAGIGAMLIALTALMLRFPASSDQEQATLVPEILQQQPPVQPAVLTQPQERSEIHLKSAGGGELRNGAQLNLQGYILIKQGRYAEAIPFLREAIDTYPPDTPDVAYRYALYNLGHALRRTGKPKQAIYFLEKAVMRDTSWTKAWTELGVARAEAAGAHPVPATLNSPATQTALPAAQIPAEPVTSEE